MGAIAQRWGTENKSCAVSKQEAEVREAVRGESHRALQATTSVSGWSNLPSRADTTPAVDTAAECRRLPCVMLPSAGITSTSTGAAISPSSKSLSTRTQSAHTGGVRET